jgi:hypothetical protein
VDKQPSLTVSRVEALDTSNARFRQDLAGWQYPPRPVPERAVQYVLTLFDSDAPRKPTDAYKAEQAALFKRLADVREQFLRDYAAETDVKAERERQRDLRRQLAEARAIAANARRKAADALGQGEDASDLEDLARQADERAATCEAALAEAPTIRDIRFTALQYLKSRLADEVDAIRAEVIARQQKARAELAAAVEALLLECFVADGLAWLCREVPEVRRPFEDDPLSREVSKLATVPHYDGPKVLAGENTAPATRAY